MTAVRTTSRGVGALTDVLLAQVAANHAIEIAPISETAASGLVVSGDDKAKMIIRYMRDHRYRQVLLPDRERYKGRNRLPAAHPFDPDWISWQRRLRQPVIMPDAGYVAEGDRLGLQAVLRNSAAIPGAIAPLALANWWLYGEGLRFLLADLAGYTVPIALILEHVKDPLGVRRILEGVLAVIHTGIPVIPLRSDSSSIGLLAHGALAAGYGSTTALRHLYPVTNSRGGPLKSRESAFWPAGMAHHYQDTLYDAVAASPQDPRWLCSCTVCGGGRVDRLATTSVDEIRRHNLACLLDLRHQIASLPTGSARVRAWSSWCRQGVQAHASVNTGAVALGAPDALYNWQKV